MKTLLIIVLLVAMNAEASFADTIGKNYFGASTVETLDKVTAYSKAKDYAALGKLIQSGQAVLLKSGTEVDVIERTRLGSIIKVHVHGTTDDWWTDMEAVK